MTGTRSRKKRAEAQNGFGRFSVPFDVDHREHELVVTMARKPVNVKGYHLWTFMDNWSWTNAFKNRYGLVSVDLGNNWERSVKKSGWRLKDVIARGGF